MERGRVYDTRKMAVMLQNERLPCSSEILDSFWISHSSPSYQGSSSMVNFENSAPRNGTDREFFPPLDKEESGNEDYDRCFHQPEKKRRLSVDQVQFLERSFEVENKLEPERKVQLAKELGLQPRQIAIWFQNRRARYKTKQLEKEYDSLKASHDKLKADCDSLIKENEKLNNEVHLLKEKVLPIEKGKLCDPMNSLDAQPQQPIPNTISQNRTNVAMVVRKQEEANSAKSDVFDSESPHCTDGNHSSFLDPADSSHVFEPDQSDFSQDEEDNRSRSFLPPPCFPKLEDVCYDDLNETSCTLGCTAEDQAFWFWPY